MNITSEWTGNTRFADASITTSGGTTDTSSVTATIGRRRASASTNVLDDASLNGRWSWRRSWRGCRRKIPS